MRKLLDPGSLVGIGAAALLLGFAILGGLL